jgi:NAD+ kinase
MKLALFGKGISGENNQYLVQLIDKLLDYECELFIYRPFLESLEGLIPSVRKVSIFEHHQELHADTGMVLSVGGDGTLLDTVALVRDSGIPVLGINLGRLGFLSSIARNDIIPAIDKVIRGAYTLDQRTLLHLIKKNGLFGDFSYALNDITVTRKDSTNLIVIHVHVDDVFLNSYWADGLIVATPTGSTAYSLSGGGPIITPDSENFVITPLAPHNLTIRPIVIPDRSEVRITVEGRDQAFLVSLDSKTGEISPGEEIVIRKAAFKFNLVKPENKDFFTTIRDKLKWGLDARN